MTDTLISDDAYRETQELVQSISGLILTIDGATLDAFIRRGENALAVSPILHPSEFRAASGHLEMVLAHARAVRHAQRRIQRSLL